MLINYIYISYFGGYKTAMKAKENAANNKSIRETQILTYLFDIITYVITICLHLYLKE